MVEDVITHLKRHKSAMYSTLRNGCLRFSDRNKASVFMYLDAVCRVKIEDSLELSRILSISLHDVNVRSMSQPSYPCYFLVNF